MPEEIGHFMPELTEYIGISSSMAEFVTFVKIHLHK